MALNEVNDLDVRKNVVSLARKYVFIMAGLLLVTVLLEKVFLYIFYAVIPLMPVVARLLTGNECRNEIYNFLTSPIFTQCFSAAVMFVCFFIPFSIASKNCMEFPLENAFQEIAK